MKLPLEITFRDIPKSDFVEANIREKAAKLDTFYDHIMACRVIVEAPHSHKQKGTLYHVIIDVTVPDGELVVDRAHDDNHAHEDVYVAIRDAFDAMRRQLKAYASKRRGDVKRHEAPPHGNISSLHLAEGFGRIMTNDGRDIYFHRNSIINADFDELDVGEEVRFSEEAGEEGPQATTVQVVGKHHIVG